MTLEKVLRQRRDAGRKLLLPYVTGGLMGWQDAIRAAAANGADAVGNYVAEVRAAIDEETR